MNDQPRNIGFIWTQRMIERCQKHMTTKERVAEWVNRPEVVAMHKYQPHELPMLVEQSYKGIHAIETEAIALLAAMAIKNPKIRKEAVIKAGDLFAGPGAGQDFAVVHPTASQSMALNETLQLTLEEGYAMNRADKTYAGFGPDNVKLLAKTFLLNVKTEIDGCAKGAAGERVIRF